MYDNLKMSVNNNNNYKKKLNHLTFKFKYTICKIKLNYRLQINSSILYYGRMTNISVIYFY